MLRLTNAEDDKILLKERDRKRGSLRGISAIKSYLAEGD